MLRMYGAMIVKKKKKNKKTIYLPTESHVNQIKLKYILKAGYQQSKRSSTLAAHITELYNTVIITP